MSGCRPTGKKGRVLNNRITRQLDTLITRPNRRLPAQSDGFLEKVNYLDVFHRFFEPDEGCWVFVAG